MMLRPAQGFGNQAPGGSQQPGTDLSWSKALQPSRIPARMPVRPTGACGALEPKTYRNSCVGGKTRRSLFFPSVFPYFNGLLGKGLHCYTFKSRVAVLQTGGEKKEK